MAKQTQIDKFRETARALEADKDEGKFNDALKRVAKAPAPEGAGEKSKRGPQAS